MRKMVIDDAINQKHVISSKGIDVSLIMASDPDHFYVLPCGQSCHCLDDHT
ncbi:Uncharacterised protein [Serratia quinivorans]|jgi:hypothetical protein|nr:Uncharacterised protein [Serratia quinivorans]CAI2138336.1 Uncharacterised protein [Serratia quinivorans]